MPLSNRPSSYLTSLARWKADKVRVTTLVDSTTFDACRISAGFDNLLQTLFSVGLMTSKCCVLARSLNFMAVVRHRHDLKFTPVVLSLRTWLHRFNLPGIPRIHSKLKRCIQLHCVYRWYWRELWRTSSFSYDRECFSHHSTLSSIRGSKWYILQ